MCGVVWCSCWHLSYAPLQLVQAGQYDVIFALLRPETREHIVAWLGHIIDLNSIRVRMNPDPRLTSSDGFLLNLTSVLLRLCAPFLDDQQKVRI